MSPLLNDVLQCYAAHRQLALCPYFPAACGAYNASLAAVPPPPDGARFTLFYEHIHACSLGHLVRAHGAVAETQPLFRRVARELLCALCALEEQCTYTLETPLCLDNVFVADSGTRLSLGRLAWGGEVPEASADAPARLRDRSRLLASSLAGVLDALNGGGGGGGVGAPRALSGVVDCVNAREGEEVQLRLPAARGTGWSAHVPGAPLDAFGRPVVARVAVTNAPLAAGAREAGGDDGSSTLSFLASQACASQACGGDRTRAQVGTAKIHLFQHSLLEAPALGGEPTSILRVCVHAVSRSAVLDAIFALCRTPPDARCESYLQLLRHHAYFHADISDAQVTGDYDAHCAYVRGGRKPAAEAPPLVA